MIVIGNNEKCPFCQCVMKDHLIDGKSVIDHMTEKHEKEFMKSLFDINTEGMKDGDGYF